MSCAEDFAPNGSRQDLSSVGHIMDVGIPQLEGSDDVSCSGCNGAKGLSIYALVRINGPMISALRGTHDDEYTARHHPYAGEDGGYGQDLEDMVNNTHGLVSNLNIPLAILSLQA